LVKELDMKKILLITLLLIVGCSKPVNEETLIEKGGLKYHPDTKELYSGKVFKNRLGGKKEFEGFYKNGKKDGKWIYWNNGIVYDTETYTKHIQDNLNSNIHDIFAPFEKKRERTYKNGRITGLQTGWDVEGNKTYENMLEDGYRNGLLTSWYPNGQKEYEGTFKNDFYDGLQTTWYENGQKKSEATWKDGKVVEIIGSWNEDGSLKE
jgi:antitoxin component YwqK of YwqJK toxin-antitoxin module